MNFHKFIKAAALSLSLIFVSNTACLAATYKDVPSTHYAYDAISRISDLGFLVGDMSGNFNPGSYIDKFQTVDILSRIAGYKDINTTTAEQAFQDQAYEKHKSFINLYSNKFTKWNSVRDKQIAFLLEKEILTRADLDQFVVYSTEGVEQLRALMREEIAVFIVKLMGRNNEALTYNIGTNLFKDDAHIATDKRPYVYYLRSISIMNGSDNSILPRSAISKAEMSLLLVKVLDIIANPTSGGTTSNNTQQPAATSIVQGTITGIYDTVKAIQVFSNDANYNNKIIMLSSTASITIDGVNKTYNDLRLNMTFSGIVQNNTFTQIAANSAVVTTPIPTPTPTATPTPTPTPTATPTPSQLTTIEGVVKSITNSGVAKGITIEVQMLNLRGEVITEDRYYTVDGSCVITKNGSAANFNYIDIKDLAVAKVSGGIIYTLTIEERDKQFSGTLIGKRVADATGVVILTIEDNIKNKYELRINNSTTIARRGYGTVTWKDLRIGDAVDIRAEYDTLKDIYATGSKTNMDGIIKALYISGDDSYIILQNSDTKVVDTYYVITGSVDMYTLTVGSEIRVRLDSKEISSISLLKEAVANSVYGYISYVTRSTVVLKESLTSQVVVTEFNYNSNTVFLSAETGNIIKIDDVNDNARVYVVYTDTSNKMAKTVTVMDN